MMEDLWFVYVKNYPIQIWNVWEGNGKALAKIGPIGQWFDKQVVPPSKTIHIGPVDKPAA